MEDCSNKRPRANSAESRLSAVGECDRAVDSRPNLRRRLPDATMPPERRARGGSAFNVDSYVPRHFKSYCPFSWRAHNLWKGATGRKHMDAVCGHAPVQVMVSATGDFGGDMRRRQMQTVPFSMFLNSLDEPPAEVLNLAQAQIWPPEEHSLLPLACDIQPPPALLAGIYVDSVHLWMAPRLGCRTNLHYDNSHNLLCVVSGKKRVTMFPPTKTLKLAPHPLWGESSNHSQIDVKKPNLCCFPEFVEAEHYKIIVELTEGDALFIPEGFWHCVESAGETVAVNYWWTSRLTKQLTPIPAAVHLRSLLRRHIDGSVRNRLDNILIHPDFLKLQADPQDLEMLEVNGMPLFCWVDARQCCKLHRLKSDEHVKAWQQDLLGLSVQEVVAANLIAFRLFLKPNSVPGYAEVFKGLEPCSLRRVLLFVKDHFSAAVSVMLWNLQPATTMLLVQSFESADAEGLTKVGERDFYDVLYSNVPKLRELEMRMIAQQEEYSKSVALSCIVQLVGM